MLPCFYSSLIDFQCCLIYSSEVSLHPVTPTFLPLNHTPTQRELLFSQSFNLKLGFCIQVFYKNIFINKRYLDLKQLLGKIRMIN